MSTKLPTILSPFLLTAWTIVAASPPSTAALLENPARTEEKIDRYCASIDLDDRKQCYRHIIAPLESVSSQSARRLLVSALRTLRQWTEEESELADLRRREQALYREILRHDPKDSDARYFLAVSQEKTDDTNEFLKELLDDEPGNVAAAWVLSTNTLHDGTNEDIRELVGRLRTAYEHAGQPENLILASETVAALARLDEQAADQFRHQVRADYGVFTALKQARQAVGSGAPVADKVLAAKRPIEQYCSGPYLHFDADTCRQGVALMMEVEKSAPTNLNVLHALISGMQALHWPGFGPANDYSDELRDRFERLIAIEGRSTELLTDYATVLKVRRQIEVLESIIANDPAAPAEAHALLARALFKDCDYESGLERMRTAFERSEGRKRSRYGVELAQALRYYGTPQDALEADRIEKMLKEM